MQTLSARHAPRSGSKRWIGGSPGATVISVERPEPDPVGSRPDMTVEPASPTKTKPAPTT